jgi:DHA3 family tetracycline resistance protein-like MFS transporter
MPSVKYFEPLKHRDFALLWSGQAVSQLGDGVFTVTVALEALRVDHSPIGLSYVLAARLLPAVMFTLVGGVIVDRVPRRLVMLAADLMQGAAVAVVAVLVATHAIHLISLVVMALVFGVGDALFFPAAMAITPEIVPSEMLLGASALTSTSMQVGRVLIGPALGGLVVGLLGVAWGFGINAASFAVSAATLAAMSTRSRPIPSGESPLADIREGLRFLFSQRWLWVTTLGAALGNFVAFSPLGVLVPLLVKRELHGGGIALGLVLAAGGLGGVVASVVLGNREPPHRRLVHLWLGWGLSGVGVLGLGLVPDVWLAGGVAFVTYGLDAYGSVLFNPLIQQGVPDVLLGRVSSVDYVLGYALSPLGLVAAGAAADLIGVRTTLIIGGAITALTTLIPLLPGVRDPTSTPFDELPPGDSTSPEAA